MSSIKLKIQDCRRTGELVRDRLHLLSGKDKILMTMYLEGQGIRQLAVLAGVSASALRRKLQRLVTALAGAGCENYLLALRNRDKFTPAELFVARDRLIRGLSIKKIARRRKTTYYRSYRMVCKIERMLEICRKHIQFQEISASRRTV